MTKAASAQQRKGVCCTFELANVTSQGVELTFVHHLHELDTRNVQVVERAETTHFAG
jgi:hypothetical protein